MFSHSGIKKISDLKDQLNGLLQAMPAAAETKKETSHADDHTPNVEKNLAKAKIIKLQTAPKPDAQAENKTSDTAVVKIIKSLIEALQLIVDKNKDIGVNDVKRLIPLVGTLYHLPADDALARQCIDCIDSTLKKIDLKVDLTSKIQILLGFARTFNLIQMPKEIDVGKNVLRLDIINLRLQSWQDQIPTIEYHAHISAMTQAFDQLYLPDDGSSQAKLKPDWQVAYKNLVAKWLADIAKLPYLVFYEADYGQEKRVECYAPRFVLLKQLMEIEANYNKIAQQQTIDQAVVCDVYNHVDKILDAHASQTWMTKLQDIINNEVTELKKFLKPAFIEIRKKERDDLVKSLVSELETANPAAQETKKAAHSSTVSMLSQLMHVQMKFTHRHTALVIRTKIDQDTVGKALTTAATDLYDHCATLNEQSDPNVQTHHRKLYRAVVSSVIQFFPNPLGQIINDYASPANDTEQRARTKTLLARN